MENLHEYNIIAEFETYSNTKSEVQGVSNYALTNHGFYFNYHQTNSIQIKLIVIMKINEEE